MGVHKDSHAVQGGRIVAVGHLVHLDVDFEWWDLGCCGHCSDLRHHQCSARKVVAYRWEGIVRLSRVARHKHCTHGVATLGPR